MSDVFATIIFVFAIYCAWAIAAYKRPATAPATNPETPIDYFPEVEDDPTPEPRQITIVEPLPTAAFKPQPTASPIKIAAAEIVLPNYDTMGVRELYKIASKQGVKGYKKLRKTQLIKLLK